MPACDAPQGQSSPEFAEHLFGSRDLLLQQSTHVGAGAGAGATKGDDTPHLSKGQTEPAGLRHKGQHLQHLGGVSPIAGWGASRSRENPSRLVEPERLAAEPALAHDFTDPHPLRHALSLRLAPWGLVNSLKIEPTRPSRGVTAWLAGGRLLVFSAVQGIR